MKRCITLFTVLCYSATGELFCYNTQTRRDLQNNVVYIIAFLSGIVRSLIYLAKKIKLITELH